jgi:hypothetical protein
MRMFSARLSVEYTWQYRVCRYAIVACKLLADSARLDEMLMLEAEARSEHNLSENIFVYTARTVIN